MFKRWCAYWVVTCGSGFSHTYLCGLSASTAWVSVLLIGRNSQTCVHGKPSTSDLDIFWSTPMISGLSCRVETARHAWKSQAHLDFCSTPTGTDFPLCARNTTYRALPGICARVRQVPAIVLWEWRDLLTNKQTTFDPKNFTRSNVQNGCHKIQNGRRQTLSVIKPSTAKPHLWRSHNYRHIMISVHITLYINILPWNQFWQAFFNYI